MCCPVARLVSIVSTPPSWTCPPAVTTRPVIVEVQVHTRFVGPAGIEYVEVEQLFSSSQTGVTGLMPGVVSPSQLTGAASPTTCSELLIVMMVNNTSRGPRPG